jgi:hypothetical protein
MGVKCRIYYLMFSTNDEVEFLLLHYSLQLQLIRCATSAPDGSSPRGYSQIFYLSIGLNILRVYAPSFDPIFFSL